MSAWPLRSLLKGIRTTRWPRHEERAPGVTPGRPCPAADAVQEVANNCPTAALTPVEKGIAVDFEHCVHCQRCRHGEYALPWSETFEWTARAPHAHEPLPARFHRSLHVCYVDAGACGGCMGELRLIDAPPYNFHRFGIFITPSPRNADVLLVAGPVTENMRDAVLKAYAAMPDPKRVVAMGVCAINGGVFGTTFASAGGLANIIPVDLLIPGCPPPPLAIIHALLATTGRAQTTPLESLP